jgi:hypothetical protein
VTFVVFKTNLNTGSKTLHCKKHNEVKRRSNLKIEMPNPLAPSPRYEKRNEVKRRSSLKIKMPNPLAPSSHCRRTVVALNPH